MKFKRNDDLQEKLDAFDFFEYTYEGGKEYVSKFLVKHERESDEAFKRRKKEACVINLCAPVVDLYNFYLFRTDAARDFAGLEGNQLFNAFIEDADFYGNSYDEVIKAISEQGSIYGIFGVVIDKPNIQASSLGEELAMDIRPYISTYEPSNIWDMVYQRTNGSRPKLVQVVLEEDGLLRVWNLDTVQIYEPSKKDMGEWDLVEEINNPLGEIPFILHTNRMSLEPLEAASDIADLAEIQRAIFNDDSKIREAMGRSAFPMLELPDSALPFGNGQSLPGNQGGDEIEIGAGNALVRQTGDSVGHRYIEPTLNSIDKYLAHRAAYLNDFAMIARTQHASATQSRTPQSGVALEIEFQQLNALLSSKASCMERTERRILGFVAKWLGLTFAGSITYDDSFGVRDLAHDIDTIVKSMAVVSSATYKNEVAKQIAHRMLDDETEQTIFDQIDADLTKPNIMDVVNGQS